MSKKQKSDSVPADVKIMLKKIRAAFEQELQENCDEIPVWECTIGEHYAILPGIANLRQKFNPEEPYRYTALGRYLGKTQSGDHAFEMVFVMNLKPTVGHIRIAPTHFEDGEIATVFTITEKLLELGRRSWKTRLRNGLIKAYPKTVERDHQ